MMTPPPRTLLRTLTHAIALVAALLVGLAIGTMWLHIADPGTAEASEDGGADAPTSEALGMMP